MKFSRPTHCFTGLIRFQSVHASNRDQTIGNRKKVAT